MYLQFSLEPPQQPPRLLLQPFLKERRPPQKQPLHPQRLPRPAPGIKLIAMIDDLPILKAEGGINDIVDLTSRLAESVIGIPTGATRIAIGGDFRGFYPKFISGFLLALAQHAPHIFGVFAMELAEGRVFEGDGFVVVSDHLLSVEVVEGLIEVFYYLFHRGWDKLY